MSSRIPRRGAASGSGLRKPGAAFDPSAYAKKMAEKKAKAERIRQERRAKAAENAAAAAAREKARRDQFQSLNKSSTEPFGGDSQIDPSVSTAPLSQPSAGNSGRGKENVYSSRQPGGADSALKELIENLTKRVESLETKLMKQQANFDDTVADLENRHRNSERKIVALERDNAFLKRQVKALKSSASSAAATPAQPNSRKPEAKTVHRKKTVKPPGGPKTTIESRPASKPTPSNIDDMPVGRNKSSPFNLDEMPVGKKSSPPAVQSNIDEMPVGRNKNNPFSLDDMPVGKGSSQSPVGQPIRSNAPSNFTALEETPVGGSGNGGMPPGVSPFGPMNGGVPVDPFGSSEPVSLEPCPHCGRKFNKKALARHIKLKICRKKKRKPVKMSVLDDELQSQLKDAKRANKQSQKKFDKLKKKEAKEGKIPKWKLQRMQLQEALKAGRKMKEALASGKSLADLPPPTSSVPDDRVACKNCGRKFNEDRIQKHMSICNKINKKKKPTSARARVRR